MVIVFAWAVSIRSGSSNGFNPELGPGEHWWLNFKKRHPQLTLRKIDKLDRSRAECLDPKVVDETLTKISQGVSKTMRPFYYLMAREKKP